MSDANVRVGWIAATLADVAAVNPSRPDVVPAPGDEVTFIPMAAVEATSGKLDLNGRRTWSEVAKGYTKFQEGDVLFAKITPCMENGKIAVTVGLHGGVGAGSTEFHVLRPGPNVRASFLRYYLLQDAFRKFAKSKMKGTAGQLRVPGQVLAEHELPVPPLPEQDRITTALDSYLTRLAAAVANLERVRRNLARYRASVLQAAVEGRLVPTEAEVAKAEGREFEPASVLLQRILAERRKRWEASGKKGRYEEPVAVETAGLAEVPEGWCWASADALFWDAGYGTSQKCLAAAKGPPVLRIPNVQAGVLDLNDLKFATDSGALGAGQAVEQNDFVFIRTNGSKSLVGRGALVRAPLSNRTYFASYLIRLRLVPVESVPAWLALSWHGPVVRAQVLRDAASSAGQHNVSLSAIRAYGVALPPAQEQHRITAEVDRLLSTATATERTVAAQLTRLHRLRQSILRWAFEGRLVDQGPNDEPAAVLLERIRAQRPPTVGQRRARDSHA